MVELWKDIEVAPGVTRSDGPGAASSESYAE